LKTLLRDVGLVLLGAGVSGLVNVATVAPWLIAAGIVLLVVLPTVVRIGNVLERRASEQRAKAKAAERQTPEAQRDRLERAAREEQARVRDRIQRAGRTGRRWSGWCL